MNGSSFFFPVAEYMGEGSVTCAGFILCLCLSEDNINKLQCQLWPLDMWNRCRNCICVISCAYLWLKPYVKPVISSPNYEALCRILSQTSRSSRIFINCYKIHNCQILRSRLGISIWYEGTRPPLTAHY